MKKITLLFSIFGLAQVAISQPTLDAESFYSPGDQVIGFDVNSENINDGADGAGQVWDFSNLTTVGESSVWGGTIEDPSTLNDFDLFAEANLAMVLNNGTIRYWKNDENGLSAIGQGGDHDILALNDDNLLLTYPFTYGSEISDEANGELYGACNDFVWESTSETQGVGYGTLILPSGTFENVLKVRRISFSSKANETLGYERENNIVEHFWFQPGTSGPLLYMRSWNNNGCPGSNEGVEVVYTVPSGSSEVEEMSANEVTFNIFPNPAIGETHLNIRTEQLMETQIWISDLLGKNVLNVGNKETIEQSRLFKIDLESLQPGVYVVNIKTQDEHFSDRLVIQ